MSVLPPEDDLLAWAKSLKVPKVDKTSDVASVVDDELTALGYPGTARLSILGDVGRENNWDRNTIFKGHSDPKNNVYNRGIISWQGDRQKKLESFLKKQGVHGQNDDNELRGMVRFMDDELRNDYPQIRNKLLNPTSTYDASEALRQYIKYVPDAPYNSPDSEFRVKNNATWAKKARAMGLGQDVDIDGIWKQADSYLQPSDTQFEQSPTQSPAIQPVNGQKPLLDPKTIGQQTVTTQLPVIQSPDVPIDADKLLQKRPQVMAEAQKTGKQPVDILLEMARGEHPSQQVAQPQIEQPEATRTEATDQDFTDANTYLKSVGQPEMTREQFEVAAKATGQQAQATGYQTQAQAPPIRVAQPVRTTQTVRKGAKKSTQPNVVRPASGEVEVFRQNVKGTDKEQILREALSGLGVSASEADAGITKLKQAGKSNLLTGDPKQNSLLVLTDKDIEFFKNGKLTPQVEASLRQRVAENRTTAEALPENASFVGQYTKDGKTYRQGIPGTTDGEAPTVLQQIRGLSDNEVKKENTIWKYTFDPLYKQAVDIVGQVDGSAEDVDAEYQRLLANEDITKKQALEYGKQQGESYANDKSSRYGQARGTVASGIAGAGSEMVAYPAAIMRAINAISPEVASLGGRTLQNWLTNSSLAMAQAQATEADKNKDVVSSVIRMAGRAPGDLSRFAVSAMLPGGAALTFTKDAAITSFGQGNDTGQVFKDTGTGLATDILFRGAGKLAEAVTNKVASKLLAPEVREAIKAGALEAPYTGTDEAKRAFINTARRELVADTAGAVTRLGTIGAGAYTLAKLEGSETPGQDAAMLLLFDLAMHAKKLGQTAKLAGQIWRVPTEDAKAKPRDVMLLTEGGDKLSVYDVTGKYPDSMVEGVISRVPRADADRTAFEPRPMKGESARIVGGSVEYSKPKPAVWKNNDNDQPVTVTGEAGKFEGEQYYTIAESKTAIPANQLEFDKATFTETKAETTPVKKTAEVITENIPIVGTDVKKKTVNVKPAVEPVESEPVKQKIEEKVDEAWVNKILDPKGETAEKPVKQTIKKKVEPVAETQAVEQSVVDEKAVEKPRPLSNTQIEFSKEQAKPFEDFRSNIIDKADIADKSVLPPYAGDGLHIEPHVTVKYGLHTMNHADVAPVLKGEKPITLTLGKTSVFTGSEKKIPGTDKPVPYDVVTVEVNSPDLTRLNKKLTNKTENTTTFNEYKPHITLAYVKSGEGKKYAGKTDFEGQKYTFDGVTFSPADKSGKTTITLESPAPKSEQVQGKEPQGDATPELLIQSRNNITRQGYVIDDPKLGKRIQIVKEDGTLGGTTAYNESWTPKGLAMTPFINSKGDYEQTKDVAGRIERGEATIKRLDEAGERGRIAGGKRAIEASVILNASERANEESGSRIRPVERQERALEAYAKREGIWIDPNKLQQNIVNKGNEATVQSVDGGNAVQKTIDYKQIDKNATPLDFIDNRIAAFNQMFPETAYELVGFTRTKDGFRFVIKQPFIRDAVYTTPTERQAFMKSKGFEMVDKYGEEFANQFYHVSDLHEKNALKKPDGTILVIDAVTKAKPVSDFEVVERGLPKSPTGQDLIDALDKPVTREAVQDAKSKVTKYGTEMDMTTAVIANRLARDAGVMTVSFDGAFFEPKSTKKFIESVRKLARGMQSKSLEKFANAVEHQFNTEGIAVVYMSPEAGRHETIHKADYLGAISKALDGENGRYNGASDELKKSEPFQRFTKALDKRQGKTSHGVAMAEALAYLGDGHGAEFGLTEGESISILATLVEGYVKRNGVENLKYFKGDGLIYEIINEATREEGRSEGRDGSRGSVGSERETRPETTERKPQEDATGESKTSKLKDRRFTKTLENTGRGEFEPSTYFPDTMAGWKGEAERIINENGIEKARDMYFTGNLSQKIRNAVGIALIDHYGQQNDLDAMNLIASDMITTATSTGQAVKALDLANRYDPQSWTFVAAKYKAQSGKTGLTPQELSKGQEKVDAYVKSADDIQLADEYLKENREEVEIYDKQIEKIDEALRASKQLEDLQKEVATLQQQLADAKKDRPKGTKRTVELRKEIESRRADNLKAIQVFVRESERGSFILSPKDKYRIGFEDTGLDEEVFNAFRDEAILKLASELPKGEMTLKDFRVWINDLAKGKLSQKQQDQIMAAGVNELRQTREHELTPEQLRQQANRREFYKVAYDILGEPERLIKQKNKEIEKAYQQAEKYKQKEIEVLNKARKKADEELDKELRKSLEAEYKEQERITNEAIKEAEKAQKEREKAYAKFQKEQAKEAVEIGVASALDMWTRQLVKTAANLNVDDTTLVGANALKVTRNLSRWRAYMHGLFPEIPRNNFNEIYRKSYELSLAVDNDLKRQRAEKQAKRQLTDEEFQQLQAKRKTAISKMMDSRRELEGFYKHLALSAGRKVGKQVRAILNLPRTVQASMDLSFALRQGAALLGMESIESGKAFAVGAMKAFSEEEFDNFIYEMENDPIALDMREHGWSSRAILKNPIDFEEFYLSQLPMKLADVGTGKATAILRGLGEGFKMSERAFELQGDLQGYYIYKKWLNTLNEMTGDIDKAKRQLIRVINAGTGRGNLKAVFGQGGAAQDFLTEIFYSPRFLLSRPEFIAYTNPIGLALTPEGARGIIAKRAIGMWGKTAAIFLPLAMLGLTSLDPEDDEFMKIRNGDQTWDITGKLNEPLRGMAMLVKSGYYYGMTLSDDKNIAKMGENGLERIGSYYTDGSSWAHYFRGKLSPQTSLVVDRAFKEDFLGRPFTWTGALSTRLVPLSAQNIWNALVYDKKESLMRNPITMDSFKNNVKNLPQSAKENWSRVLTSFLPDVLGAGSTSFPREETTTADKEASYLMQRDFGKQEEKLTSDGMQKWRVESALVRLGRMGYDIDTVAQPYLDKGDLTPKDVKEIKDKAKKLWIEQKLDSATTDQVVRVLQFTTPYNWMIDPIMVKNDKNRLLEKVRLEQLLKTKADNAKKAKKLTPDELENIKKVLPNYK